MLPPRTGELMRFLPNTGRRLWLLRSLATPLAGLPLVLKARSASAAEPVYPRVIEGRPFVFPRDHGAHLPYRTEWWYVTGWIKGRDRQPLGFQVTFFRSRPGVAEDLAVASAARQLIVAHVALSDPRRGRLLHEQRVARVAFGLARASQATLDVALDDWSMVMDATGSFFARIRAREFRLDLVFTPSAPPMLQGVAGFSRKGPLASQASYYYSLPQVSVRGRLEVPAPDRRSALALLGGETRVDTVTGRAWFDHEWSSQYMAPSVVGWDWVGINLKDGRALMAFRMRDAAGATVWAGGTLRRVDGSERSFEPTQVQFVALRTWQSPRTGTRFPVAMRIDLPDLSVSLEPLMDDQELDARAGVGAVYWEGAVQAHGTGGLSGQGYLELTGYAGRLQI